MRLTSTQVEQFETNGYLVVEGGLTDADLNPVITEYEAYIDRRASELKAEGKITDLHEGAPFDERLALICRECNEIYPELDIMHFRGRSCFEFLGNENLLDIVEGIVGPEITCNPIQHVRPKLPTGLSPSGSDPHVVPWHQDAGVTWEEADPFQILTVWLPLSDSTEENGCLQIIPKTHNTGLWDHVTRQGEGTVIVDEALPGSEPVSLPMQRGSLLLMHKEIPHRSLANVSETIRWSMDLRYQKTGTPTGRPFHPDFPVRSRKQPESVLTDYEEWCRRWEQALEWSAQNKPQQHRWGAAAARS